MVSKNSKKYYIKTFGCYANEVDSDLISGLLESFGFKELDKKEGNETLEIKHALENSDILIINSCSVRQKSEDKVFGIGKMVKNSKNRRARVLLTGCMVGSALGERKRYALKELKEKTKNFDGYFAPGDVPEITHILKDFNLLGRDVALEKIVPERKYRGRNHAYVNISYGCDNFCSYCVVPYSRGCEISRSEKEILEEIKCLIKNGVTEFTLCGQNVNSWGLGVKEKFQIRAGGQKDKSTKQNSLPFAELLKKVHKIKEVKKIDFISSNPFDFTSDLVETLKLSKISNYVHIAVQSGNNEILKAMNRRHTVEEFENLIGDIRKVRPDVEIGTDIIVGFPGETREQFMSTVDLVKRIGFSVAFISMYSPRKGTFAQRNLEDDVPLKEKKWRHMYLSKVWKQSKPKGSGGIFHSRWEGSE
ncbi:MiaB/RimO family radical SAM methylthiotransferase [Patescibacteria group bacterium]|nr:MiaB/RimO family radical SAM methylthiotransferase [Patescibacteria group bacterium]